MLVGIIGRRCAGKKTVHSLLVERFGFLPAYLEPAEIEANPQVRQQPVSLVSGQPACNDEPLAALTLEAPSDCWRSDRFYVLPPGLSTKQARALRKRPYFLLLAVDAPGLVRFRRWQSQCASEGTNCIASASQSSVLEFLRLDDADYFGQAVTDAGWDARCEHEAVAVPRPSPDDPDALWRAFELSDVRVYNPTDNREQLAAALQRLQLQRPDWLRPAWDTYFMRIAELASMRTNCMKRRVGAVIVRDHRVIATGYNGTPRGTRNCNEGGCQRCNGGARAGHALDVCLCLHAEENAIIEAGRERCAGSTLFTNLCPCLACTKKIVQAGIREVVYGATYAMDTRSARLFAEAGVRMRHYPCTLSRGSSAPFEVTSVSPVVSNHSTQLQSSG
ncbi:dCMP deaminase [Cyanidioschyzon merolae strain 10D]|jgi:dCMP deaminase|uniref:Deoxycytidylate deaminase n=1 Tax=Cyanidioschyzon merolae (strain NIES-3377 / 10D) TaxID=280699 RepID=M1VAL5_CYAM1|nr:dCMP deaminase [Cyanidioschyzon merolae strain 10D]BAM82169.1 dCMP deaminase [Cyanidioschyzon merolae strain 10D]|eukprot:XP_005538205.1 dCMP deaminase [Cyanidioschyzon merolae strain 10D]